MTTQNNTPVTLTDLYAFQTPLIRKIQSYGLSYDRAYDSVSDGILKAFDRIEKFDASKGSLKNWLYSVVIRHSDDTRRAHINSKTSGGYSAEFMENVGGSYDVDYDGVVVDAGDMWTMAENLMNEKQYNCMRLRFSDDKSYKEIASDLNIPIGSVMSAISGGKKALKSSKAFADMFNQ